MTKNNLIARAFLNALGVVAYVVSLVWFMTSLEKWFESKPETWLMPAFFLILFVISASVTSSLVLLKPIMLYVEGEKRSAVHLFLYTLLFLVILALVIGFIVVTIG